MIIVTLCSLVVAGSSQHKYIAFAHAHLQNKRIPNIRQVFENRQNWPLCQGYRVCERMTLPQKLKFKKKRAKNETRTSSELLCAKNGFKKHLIFQK